jgi:hypothetical protein
MFRLNNGGDQINVFMYISGTLHINTTSTALATPNAWTHLAFVRQSGTFKLYINGVLDFSSTGISASLNTFDKFDIGRNQDGSLPDFNGNISDFRYVKGTAVYTANFTPPTAPLTAISGTQLLLKGTNAGIIDSTGRNDLETVGYTTAEPGRRQPEINTQVKKYGDSSIFFGGTGDYLSTPITFLNGDFGTDNLTVEFWMNATGAGTYVAVVGTQSIAGTTAGMWRISNRLNSANGIYFNYTTGSAFVDITFSTTNYNDGTWHHVAACRASGTLRMFVDGVSVGTPTAVSQNLSSGQKTVVGYNAQDTQYYTGYIDELRITKGVARYTTTFTPPAAAFITR